MELSSRQWHECLAGVVDHLERPSFPCVLIDSLFRIAPFDSTVIYLYDGGLAPLDLYHWSDPGASSGTSTLGEYEAGAYLLDPFFHACQRRIEPGVYTLRSIAPDRFFRSEYFRTYYGKTEITDEVGLFAHFPDHGSVVVSLSKSKANRRFSKRQIHDLETVEPLVRSAVLRHWREAPASPAKGHPAGVPLVSRFQSAPTLPGKTVLTERESEVVGFVLQGHSSESIGLNLGISPNTVKVHRKNIHAKLGISSQAQLFSMFFGFRPA